jgi:hypothetical protein
MAQIKCSIVSIRSAPVIVQSQASQKLKQERHTQRFHLAIASPCDWNIKTL